MSLRGASLLLFAEVFLLWHCVNYVPALRPGRSHQPQPSAGTRIPLEDRSWLVWVAIRSLAAALCCELFMGAFTGPDLATWLAGTCLALPVLRRYWVPDRFTAELEVAANLIFAAGAWRFIGAGGLISRMPLPAFGLTTDRVAAYLIFAALLVFLGQGGTSIVKGILCRGGTMPPPTEATEGVAAISTNKELKHGKMIGNVERLILAVLVANGQFQSLAFFFAAKGLIRSKELESRAWADYLLLGSLASFVTALIVGLMMAQLLKW